MKSPTYISIGQLAKRVGTSVSAIRFYETKGLINSIRSAGGQRQFLRADIRRLSFILISQQLGFSLQDIAQQLEKLPDGRNPTQKDWEKISRNFRTILDQRIDAMTRMRDRLDGCIGCGCLSLKKCQIYNENDHVSGKGAGPRFILPE